MSINIFEFLGLKAEHRKLSNKVTQLVKHFDEVPDSKKTAPFAVQKKEDGVCTLLVVAESSAMWAFSRTGKALTNMNNILVKYDLRPGVYMGETCCDPVSLEVLSGMINPNRVEALDDERADMLAENGRIAFFDFVTLEEFIAGKSERGFRQRWQDLNSRLPTAHVLGYAISNEAELDRLLGWVVDAGGEGIVIRSADAGWEAGHKGWRVMKKVRGCDYDLKCIGYEEGTGKYTGKIANLLFSWKGGREIKAMLGKGWTHDMAEQMFNSIQLKDPVSPYYPLGYVFQVYALEESSKGVLRLPKVGEMRFDKEVSDV